MTARSNVLSNRIIYGQETLSLPRRLTPFSLTSAVGLHDNPVPGASEQEKPKKIAPNLHINQPLSLYPEWEVIRSGCSNREL